jgi:hypothetical protein
MRPQGLSHLKIPVTPSEIEPATFQLVAQCLNQRRNRVTPPPPTVIYPQKLWLAFHWKFPIEIFYAFLVPAMHVKWNPLNRKFVCCSSSCFHCRIVCRGRSRSREAPGVACLRPSPQVCPRCIIHHTAAPLFNDAYHSIRNENLAG